MDAENLPTAEEVHDLDLLAKKIARQKHNFDGNPIQAYHAVTRGWFVFPGPSAFVTSRHLTHASHHQTRYLNEIVRRVTKGKSMGQIMREEIAPKLGVDFFYGLPESYEDRVCRMVAYPQIRSLAAFMLPRWMLRDPPPARIAEIMKDPNHPCELPRTSHFEGASISYSYIFGSKSQEGFRHAPIFQWET